MCHGLRWRGPGRIADVFGAFAADGPRSGPVRIRIVAGRGVPSVSRALFCVFPVPGGASLVRGCADGRQRGPLRRDPARGRGCADDPRNEDRAAVRQIARGVAYSERPSKAVRTKREGVRNPSDIPPRSSELFTRLELVTSSLPRKCSTTELKQQLLAL